MCFPRRKLTKTGRWYPVQNNAWTQIVCWHTRLLHNINKRQCRVRIMFMENTNYDNAWLGTLCTQPKTDTAQDQLSRMRRVRWCERTLEIELNKLWTDRLKGDPTSCSVLVSIGNGWRREDYTAWWVGVSVSIALGASTTRPPGSCTRSNVTDHPIAGVKFGKPHFRWFIENGRVCQEPRTSHAWSTCCTSKRRRRKD